MFNFIFSSSVYVWMFVIIKPSWLPNPISCQQQTMNDTGDMSHVSINTVRRWSAFTAYIQQITIHTTGWRLQHLWNEIEIHCTIRICVCVLENQFDGCVWVWMVMLLTVSSAIALISWCSVAVQWPTGEFHLRHSLMHRRILRRSVERWHQVIPAVVYHWWHQVIPAVVYHWWHQVIPAVIFQ